MNKMEDSLKTGFTLSQLAHLDNAALKRTGPTGCSDGFALRNTPEFLLAVHQIQKNAFRAIQESVSTI
jgi:hypothetical protein